MTRRRVGRALVATTIALAFAAGPAGAATVAAGHRVGKPLPAAWLVAHVKQPCPTQTFTIIDRAHVGPAAIARVEWATELQSIELRHAWGTPCARFGPGGWPVTLRSTQAPSGDHFPNPARVDVFTGRLPLQAWSVPFSHEIMETLVDSPANRGYWHNGTGYQLEVCDPVRGHNYRIAGVYVADFVAPAYFAGATTGDPITADGITTYPGPPVAAPDSPGPFDRMRALSRSWQDWTSHMDES